jgi:hypothetical protein
VVGFLSSPGTTVFLSTADAVLQQDLSCTCVLIGESSRYNCCLYRSGYRPYKSVSLRHWSSKFLVTGPPLAGLGVLGKFGVLVGLLGATQSGPILALVFVMGIVALEWLLHRTLYMNKIAHLIWIKDDGDGHHELCGAGEMGYRAFLRAKPKMATIKLK